MKRRISVLFVVVIIALFAAIPASAGRGNNGALGVIYVTSQDLFYDTFATADTLPMQGPFQKLDGTETEFGPGDPGYLGGRWWVDENNSGDMDEGDTFFLCPLLGPGRETPSRVNFAV